MSLFRRLLAPISVAAAFAVAAPAAHAQVTDSASFPNGTTVDMVDTGVLSDTVSLTVTANSQANLDNTVLFFGGSIPFVAISVDGVFDSPYLGPSVPECSVYDLSLPATDAPVIEADNGLSFSIDLPKGEIIAFESADFAPGIKGTDTACAAEGYPGLEIDYVNQIERIEGFDWANPAAPDVTEVAGGRRQIALSFDQAVGTQYDIYRVVGGVVETTPFVANVRGDGDGVQVVVNRFPGEWDAPVISLETGTEYSFQIEATRLFERNGEEQLASPLSAVQTATTDAVQTIQFSVTPAVSTTARSAQFNWTVTTNPSNEAPWCVLDPTESSGTVIPCTAAGATIDAVSVGAHKFVVYPPDGEASFAHTWTVVAPPAPPVAPPVNLNDLDGDGIDNTWLVGGKAAPAPATPKARVTGGNVKLTLKKAPKGAKKIRVYRADGKGGYKLVSTLSVKSKSFTDKKIKAGHTYKYKTVAVNAKGQQGAASKTATVKVKKTKKK